MIASNVRAGLSVVKWPLVLGRKPEYGIIIDYDGSLVNVLLDSGEEEQVLCYFLDQVHEIPTRKP